MRSVLLTSVLLAIGTLALPRTAGAQSAIAGTVKDATGAVLPGVTVEASSPALIEKTKSAVTNEAGQYRVVDLRPGVYAVTFTLTGFSSVRREGVVLEANFTAPINVEMKVGAVAESVTVTGQSPVVDVQTSQRREVVNQQLLEALPTGRNFQLMAGTVPSVTTGVFDVGGSSAMWTGGSLLVHGSITNDSRTLIDGMVVDAMFGGGQCSCVYDNENQTQEMAVQVTGGSAENQLSGVLVNRIPRTGGNTFSGDGLFLYANDKLQGSNLDSALMARGLTSGAKLYRDYDINYSGGGPIIKDRLWFFASGRNYAYNNYVAGAFNPDGSPAIDDNIVKAFPGRLTSQLDSKNRLTAMFDWANKIRGHRNLAANITPAASIQQSQPAEHILQGKWTSTLTSHLLLEAGYTQSYNAPLYTYEPEVVPDTCHAVFTACAPGTYGSIAHQDTILGTQYVAAVAGPVSGSGPAFMPALSHVVQASLSYVSGAHAFKVGFQDRFGYAKDIRTSVNGDLIQQYRSGTPSFVLILNTPFNNEVDVNSDFGVFVQDTWTTKRLTLSPGIRFDHFNSSIPAQTEAAGRFVPVRQFDGMTNVPNWNNISPRIGASYDLTGKGRTAIKGNFGVYVQSQGPGFASTYNPAVFSTDQRTWNDLNKDDVAQENEIGPTSNVTFGVRRNQNPDPNIKRPYQRVWDIGIQHEIFRGLAVSVSYNQRNFYNIIWTQNLSIPYSEYTIVNIPDPQGNGGTIPVYNVNRSVFGQVNELDTNSNINTRVYKGVDVSVGWRIPGGGTLTGGTSTGRTLTNTCDVEDPNNQRFCDYNQYSVPLQTLFKLSGTYPLPYGIRLSGTFQHTPGSERTITYQVTRTQVPTLVAAQVSERLNEPGSVYNDTVNQTDLSITKSFRRGRYEVRPELSVFNLFNSNAVLTQTNAFGSALGNALTILPQRMARLGLAVRF
ncbi:MAG TPA: TonB-dependent receptor [Vicinamibacterales bacterium]|nr:TonB-dependent receptor [Vicinamibacterales bacterium]